LFDIYKAYLKQMKDIKNETVDREIEIINGLLPKQLSSEKINEIILDLFSSNESLRNDFGKVMTYFKSLYSGMFNPGDIRTAWMSLK